MNEFEKYYLDDAAQKQLIENAIVVFDTSALLDLYFYSESTLDEIIQNVFKKLKERLWLPHQVKFEFFKNKDKVFQKPADKYNSLISKTKGDGSHISKMMEGYNEFEKKLDYIKNQFKTLKEKTSIPSKHPYIETKHYSKINNAIIEFDKALSILKSEINDFEKSIETVVNEKVNIINASPSDAKIVNLVDSYFKAGTEYSFDKLMKIMSDGLFRYSNKIPPGYEDTKDKIGLQVYGDLLLWKQILDYASLQKKPLIFVCNDVKEDWIDAEKKPRFELLKEFNSVANKNFWMYNVSDFLHRFNAIIAKPLNEEVLQEIRTYERESRTPVDYEEAFLQDISESEVDMKIEKTAIPVDADVVNEHKFKAYISTNEYGERFYILTYAIYATNYTQMFHPLKNIEKIRKYHESLDIEFDNYSLFIFCDDYEFLEKCWRHMSRPNIRKINQSGTFDVRFYILKNGHIAEIKPSMKIDCD